MAKGIFNKEILRSIRGSLGRFIAIAGIVALGCGFYAGLRMTAPDMNYVADEYYDQVNLMDIRVVSTLGMTDEDIEDLKAIEGVEEVAPAYETDVMAEIDDEQYAIRVHSLISDMNELGIVEGELPSAPGECVLSADKVMGTNVPIGDKVYLMEATADIDDVLVTDEFTVVGFAHSPYYVSSVSMGVTTLGSGVIQQFMYVTKDSFASDYPITEAFITVKGAKDYPASSDEYQAAVDEVTKRIEEIAPGLEARRLDTLKAEAQEKLDDARAEYEQKRSDAEAELEDAKSKLDSAKAEIESSERKLDSAERDYANGQRELASQKSSAEAQLKAAEQKIAEGEAGLKTIDDQIAATTVQLQQLRALYEAETDPVKKQEYGMQIAGIEKALEDASKTRADIAKSVTNGKAEIEKKRAEAEREFANAEAKLASAKKQIDSGRAELAKGRAKYESGLSEYQDGRAKADEEFADAEAELADAQAKVDDIQDLKSEWLIMDRTKNHGVVSFESDATRVDNIAAVFPFIFFLVAALVALTTMTRMVEEDRMLIGTLKALGYSKRRITSKYMIYAGVASGVGAILGILILSLVLPPVIMVAYSIIYYVPHSLILPIELPIALISAALGIGVTLFATWFACTSTLRESPAYLMLPRAPKAGKRILLERAKPIWTHLSFLWKVTFRNIFRYKKRFLMTVIGIGGCTALLLTGLGLQDSINDIIDKQFGATVHYDVVTTFEDEDSLRESEGEILGLVTDGTAVHEGSIKPIPESGEDLNAVLIVPENSDDFERLWYLRERASGTTLNLGDDGVIINEKLANELGISKGDTIVLANQDEMGNATNERYELIVSGVMENYVNNYVFIGKDAFITTFGESPEYTSIYGNIPDSPEAREQFSSAARGIDGVKTIAFNNETIDTYKTMLKSVNMIVVVLVIAAAALAFIVLYNLTNINITERMREIATLKVLGFTQKEIYLYIFREIMLLTVIGALVGLLLGIWLEGFVVVTAEVDYVMFGRDIHPTSFVWAFLLTLAFAIIVMLFMRKKLDNVDMVESLKSNE